MKGVGGEKADKGTGELCLTIRAHTKKMSIIHYTDANAVYSILRNGRIWLTDLRFLNDSRELHDGVDILSKALEAPEFGVFTNHEYKDASIEYLRSAFSDTVTYGIDEEPIFVFSFSRRENLLSQWRAYGSYAIEFDAKVFTEEISGVRQCVYVQKEKKDTAKIAVTRALNIISQDMGNNGGGLSTKSLDALGDLIELAATFKDKGFSEEEEFRVISQAGEGDDSIKFRHKNNKLIPYLEMDISLDCIKAVHIGPMSEQELAYTSMAAFVRKIEKDWQIDSANIEYELNVKKSSIPYRGNG